MSGPSVDQELRSVRRAELVYGTLLNALQDAEIPDPIGTLQRAIHNTSARKMLAKAVYEAQFDLREVAIGTFLGTAPVEAEAKGSTICAFLKGHGLRPASDTETALFTATSELVSDSGAVAINEHDHAVFPFSVYKKGEQLEARGGGLVVPRLNAADHFLAFKGLASNVLRHVDCGLSCEGSISYYQVLQDGLECVEAYGIIMHQAQYKVCTQSLYEQRSPADNGWFAEGTMVVNDDGNQNAVVTKGCYGLEGKVVEIGHMPLPLPAGSVIIVVPKNF